MDSFRHWLLILEAHCIDKEKGLNYSIILEIQKACINKYKKQKEKHLCIWFHPVLAHSAF